MVLGQIRPHIETLCVAHAACRDGSLRDAQRAALRTASRRATPSSRRSSTPSARAIAAAAQHRRRSRPDRRLRQRRHARAARHRRRRDRRRPAVRAGHASTRSSAATRSSTSPQELLRRQLLPYWASLLKPGGIAATIAPDLEAMAADFASGEMPFEDFREVAVRRAGVRGRLPLHRLHARRRSASSCSRPGFVDADDRRIATGATGSARSSRSPLERPSSARLGRHLHAQPCRCRSVPRSTACATSTTTTSRSIVVNGPSTDHTLEVLAPWRDRIRYRRQPGAQPVDLAQHRHPRRRRRPRRASSTTMRCPSRSG